MADQRASEAVVLLHGLGCHGWIMSPLAARIGASGFRIENWSYPSGQFTIAHHGEWLRDKLTRLCDDPAVERVSIVGHSMGNIVTRAALLPGGFEKLSRVVMLAPPNRGSYWADWLGYPLRWLWNTLPELQTNSASFVNQLPREVPASVGVLAARFDELVPVWSTYLDRQSDHLVVNAMHNSILFQPGVARQVTEFLKHGRFERATVGSPNLAVSQAKPDAQRATS